MKIKIFAANILTVLSVLLGFMCLSLAGTNIIMTVIGLAGAAFFCRCAVCFYRIENMLRRPYKVYKGSCKKTSYTYKIAG